MRTKLLILSIIASAGFSFAADAVLFGNMLETDTILTPEGVTNAILTTALTVEADPVAYPIATNALALAEGALQASWAATGTVARAAMADMLRSPSSMTWLEVSGGNTYIVEVVASSNVYVVSTSGEGYNGPAVGTVWSNAVPTVQVDSTAWYYESSGIFAMTLYSAEGPLFESTAADCNYGDGPDGAWLSVGGNGMPMTMSNTEGEAVGSLIVDYIPITNRYEVAKQEPTLILINGKASHLDATNAATAAVSAHNADGDAHAALLSGYATTGAVAAVQAAVVDPWIDWSATITPINGTATVTRATGADPVLVLTDDVVISVPTTGWPTTGVSRVSLSLWAGSHSVTLLTNTVEYSSTPTISTNDWTTILFRRTGDQAKWKGVGL